MASLMGMPLDSMQVVWKADHWAENWVWRMVDWTAAEMVVCLVVSMAWTKAVMWVC
jgi:hypothetical protein